MGKRLLVAHTSGLGFLVAFIGMVVTVQLNQALDILFVILSGLFLDPALHLQCGILVGVIGGQTLLVALPLQLVRHLMAHHECHSLVRSAVFVHDNHIAVLVSVHVCGQRFAPDDQAKALGYTVKHIHHLFRCVNPGLALFLAHACIKACHCILAHRFFNGLHIVLGLVVARRIFGR